MSRAHPVTKTGGRLATTGHIAGDCVLAVGKPPNEPSPGWEWHRLTDLARLETGHTPSRKHPEYWDGGIPWIGIRDATGNHGCVLDDTIQHVSQEGIDNSSARVLPANSVCLSRTASVGYVVVMGKPMSTSQDFVNWVCNPERLDYRYLKYALLAEQTSYARFSHGTTHQTIYFPEVKAFHLCAPKLDEQKAIADILSDLDDKIELNRRMNRTLEQMAAAIFKAWFVDFEPVRAKASGATSFPSMPQPTFDALPTTFADSELGPIPDGWEVMPIGDAVQIKGGGTPSTKTPDFWDGPHHWVTPKDLSGLSDPILLDTSRCLTDAGLAKVSSGLLPRGTVLLSSRAPIGYLAITAIETAINQGFIAMLPGGSLPPSYLLNWASYYLDDIKGNANGTTFQEISKKNFRPLRAIVPSPEVTDDFQSIVGPLYDQVRLNMQESTTLAEARDALLPKLLSGEVRVLSDKAVMV